jgi:2-hydroxy-6-oxonona-2,4-dienedioate hydrolase
MTTGYVNLGDGRLYYEMDGEGETLVLNHAGFVDSRMWDDQWTELTRHFRVIRYDMRGYGKSDLATAPVARRRDLYGLLQQLGVKRAHFIGCSVGGATILDLALAHPDLVASLILVSTAPNGLQLQGPPPRYVMEMMAAMQQGNLARASDLQLRIWVDGPFREPEQVNARVRERAAEMNRIAVQNNTWMVADMQPADPLNPPAAERLSEIHVPTLVIAGALDDSEILRAADFMASGIKGAQKVIVPESAHVPNMEKPAEFNRAVLSFVDKLKLISPLHQR